MRGVGQALIQARGEVEEASEVAAALGLGGGSALDLPIRELPEFYRRIGAPAGKTDVVLVTDVVCRVPNEDRLNFLLWKKAVSARVTALVLDNGPGDLEALCDESHAVASLDACEEAVGRIKS